jgi:hypothetical protein
MGICVAFEPFYFLELIFIWDAFKKLGKYSSASPRALRLESVSGYAEDVFSSDDCSFLGTLFGSGVNVLVLRLLRKLHTAA